MNKVKSEALKLFICELVHSVAKRRSTDKLKQDCMEEQFPWVIPNVIKACCSVELGFTGISLQHESDGRILIRVTSPGDRKTGSYSLSKYDFKTAYLNAITLRAEYCGFDGTLPLDCIYIPSISELVGITKRIKGKEWCVTNKIESYYKKRGVI